jgi:hypothetical protein
MQPEAQAARTLTARTLRGIRLTRLEVRMPRRPLVSVAAVTFELSGNVAPQPAELADALMACTDVCTVRIHAGEPSVYRIDLVEPSPEAVAQAAVEPILTVGRRFGLDAVVREISVSDDRDRAWSVLQPRRWKERS